MIACSSGSYKILTKRNVQTWGKFKVGDSPVEERYYGKGSPQTAEFNTIIACLEYIKIRGMSGVVIWIGNEWTYTLVSGVMTVNRVSIVSPLLKRTIDLLGMVDARIELHKQSEIDEMLK